MPGPNDALAAVLDRGRAADESDAVLAALVDGGVHVPFNEQGSVVFIGIDDSGPLLPGYTSEAACKQWLPTAAGSVFCDAPRLLDISRHTGIATLGLFADNLWAKVPLPLVAATLRTRGIRLQGNETIRLTRSTHPTAVALRGAFAARIMAHPQVQTVWIGYARWAESGNENLLIQMAVDKGAQAAAHSLLEAALGDVPQHPDAPELALRSLETHESDQIADLNALALDTVHADRTTGRVEVISGEFD